MKTSNFTEAQITFILRQAEEGTTAGQACWPLARTIG